MTATVADPVTLHLVEVDLLCTLAEVRPPFPLNVPSTGTVAEERREMFGAARRQLAARGLAGDRGPQGEAALFVRLLRNGAGTVDLVFADRGISKGAVVLIGGQRAMIVAQSPDEPGRPVRMAQVDTDTAVRELLGMLPAVPAGDIPPFQVPLPPVRKLFGALDRRRRAAADEPEPLSDTDMDSLMWESGVDDRTASRLVTTMRNVTGSGQIGAAVWQPGPGRWKRLGDETRWIDTGHGRFRLSESEDQQWASVNPFSRNDARAELRKLAAALREADDDGDDMGGVMLDG